jgi:AraC-like DNA-binding protein
MYGVIVPHAALRLPATRLAELTAQRFSGRQGLGALVSQFLIRLGAQIASGHHAGNMMLADTVLDMLTAAFVERLSDEGSVDRAVGRRGLVLRVRAFIEKRLGDPHLDVATIAAAQYISVRYLQMVFADEGQTVTDWIRQRRIEHCRRDLANPQLAALPVGEIATRWGFVNSAHFSRVFKAVHGVGPRDYRAAVL